MQYNPNRKLVIALGADLRAVQRYHDLSHRHAATVSTHPVQSWHVTAHKEAVRLCELYGLDQDTRVSPIAHFIQGKSPRPYTATKLAADALGVRLGGSR